MELETLFSPFTISGLELKNRSIGAGCFEGMCQKGQVTNELIEHHRALAAGGISMTTVAYCSVNFEGRAFDHELWMRQEIIPDLKRLTDTVHEAGAKASIQLGHCGFFTNRKVIKQKTTGASAKWCMFMLSRCRAMTKDEIEQTTKDFVRAALEAKNAGFDAIEIHAGHGYLLSQFLSPWTNKRTDEYGGSLENRLRFPLKVISDLRKVLGDAFPILVKMNQSDGMPEGIQINDAVEIAKAFEKAGASALIPSSGFTSKVPFLMLRGNLPIKEMAANQRDLFKRIGLQLFGKFMVHQHSYTNIFQLEGAELIQSAVSIPVIYIGGVESKMDMLQVLEKGFPAFQLGRVTIQNPNFINQIGTGELDHSPCDHCNRCVAAMDAGGVHCVSNEIGFLKFNSQLY